MTPSFPRFRPAGGLMLSALSLMPAAHGIGFRLPNQDASAVARGNAFAATADNPSAIYYNPAGITQLEGTQVELGLTSYLGINTFYDSPSGNDTRSDFEVKPSPQVYFTYTPKDLPVSFGLGAYAPFGLGVEWPQDTGFRSIAIDANLKYITVNPVVAVKVLPTLSVAMGPTINYSQVAIYRGIARPNDAFNFRGEDFAYGFNAGILWQPLEKWSFGANYRSATTLDYSGHSDYNPGNPEVNIPSAATTASVAFPRIVSGGVSYRPTPRWNVEVNVDYTDWKSLKTVTLEGTSQLGFPIDLPLQFDWMGTWMYELGVTYKFDSGWFVSGGYFHISETIQTQYYTPAVPDSGLHVACAGFGYSEQHWSFAVAAQMIVGPDRDVVGSPTNPFSGESADGTYQIVIPTISFSVGYHF